MTEPRQIATVRSYDELLELLRQRVQALGINYAILDDIACFGDGQANKVLAHTGLTRTRTPDGRIKRSSKRHLTPATFDGYLAALGLDLIAVENAENVAKTRAWLERESAGRKASVRMLPIGSMPKATWLITPKKSPWLNKMRNEKLPPERRSEIARQAARKRWKTPQVTEIQPLESGALPPNDSSGIPRGANKKTS